MADRYWVGGTGTWGTGTTNWSTSSGGFGGASAPTSADNVIFDQNSNSGTNAFTVTISAGVALNCLDLTIQNLDGAMTLAGSTVLNIYGNLNIPATNLTITYGSVFTFLATTAKTITTNGTPLSCGCTFSGTGGTWTLQDNLTLSNLTYGASIRLTAGTIDLNGNLLTCTSFTTDGTTTRSISSATNTSIKLTGDDTLNFLGLTGTGLSISNTVYFDIAGTYLTTTGNIINTTTIPVTVKFTNTGISYVITLGTGSLFKTLDFTNLWNTTLSIGTTSVSITEALVIPSTLSISGTAGTNHFVFAPPSTTTATLTNNGTAINYGVSVNGVGGTLQLTEAFTQGSTQLLTLTNGTLNVNSQTVSAGVFTVVTGTHAITNGTVTAASVTHTSGDLSIGTGYNVVCTGAYTFTAGSITINNGVNLSIGSMSSANTGTRSIAFGTGSITTTGTGTVWNVTGVTGLTYTGTSNITLSNNTATAATITNTATAASAMNFNIINGTYALTLTTGNSYNNLNFTGFAGTWSAGTTTHTMYGNLVIPASGGTLSSTAGTSTLTWAATSGTKTITTNGRTINFGIALNGIGQTVQLADSFTQGSTQTLTLTSGTLDINSQTVSAGIFTILSGTHAIANGTLNCASVTHTSGDLTVSTTATVVSTGTYTFASGTINIGNGATLSTGLFSSSNSAARSIAFNTSGILALTSSGTVWDTTTVTNFSYTGTSNVRLTYAGATAVTLTPGAMTEAQSLNFYVTAGTYTLTTTNNGVFNTLDFTGFSGTHALGSANINLKGNLTYSPTMSTSSTAGSAFIYMNASTGTKLLTTNGITLNHNIGITGGTVMTVQLVDNFRQNSTYYLGLGTGTLDINSKTVNAGVFNIITGTHAFINGTINCSTVAHSSGDLTVSTTATVICTGTYTYTTGTINIGNGATLSVGQFSSSNSNARSIAFNTSGILALTGSGTVWNTGTVTNFSYTGTSNVRLTNSGSTATTITPGSMTAAQALNFYITAGTYSLTITSLSNVNTLDFTGFSGTYAGGTSIVFILTNLVFSGTMTGTNSSGGSLRMAANSGIATITTNGATIGNNIYFGGTGTFQLADNFTQASTASFTIDTGTIDFNNKSYTLGILTFVNGTNSYINYGGTLRGASIVHTSGTVTLDTGALVATAGSYTFTAGTITLNNGVNLSVGSMSSANTNTRVIAFGTGSITTTGTGTVWNVTGITGLSYTGTSNVIISNNTATAVTITNTATAASAINFNIINGTYTLTLTTGNSYNNLNFTGFAGTVAFGATTHTMYGNLTLGASTNTSATAGTTTIGYGSTSGTRTITTNGQTANFGIIINGVGQTVQLADAFVQGSTQRLTIANGTFDMAGYSTSAGVLTINTGTHAIANGTLNCASVTHTSGDLSMGTGYTVVCSGTYTFTAGSITINDGVNLSVGSMSSANTGTRSIAFGTGSITTTGTGTVWNVTGVTGMTYTGTPTVNISNNTATAITVTNTATILSAFDFKFINGTYTLTLTNGNTYRSLNFTGFAGTVAFGATTHSLYGDLTLGPNTTTSGTVGSTHVSFIAGLLTKTITTNGRTVNFTININGASTTVYLGDAFVQGSSYSLILTVGTFDMANYSTSVGIFNISNGTHAIANGTLNCASVTHTAADLTVSTTATVVATGTYTFTSGTINIGNGATLTTGTFSSANSNARSIAFNTSGILALTSSGTVWNTSTVTNFSYTGTSNIRLTYAGALSVTINTGAMSVAQSLNFYVTAGTYNLTTTNGGVFNTLDFTGFGGTYAQAATNTTVYGNLSFSNLMTSTSTTGTMTIAGTANTFIYGNGHTVGCNIKISKTSGTAQTVLGNAFSSSYTNGLILEGGIFDTAGYNFTVVSFDAGNTSLSRSIKLNSSNVTITGIQWLVAASNLTVDAGTSTISMTSASSKAFYGGGFTWYNLNQGGAGSLSMGDSNTFNDITNTVQPATVYFQTSNTTVSNFSLSGTAGNPITITSTTGSHTLTKTSGEVFVSYCIISNSNATGGALWRAPTNYGNTNGGSNTGWNFSPTSTTAVLSNMIAFF